MAEVAWYNENGRKVFEFVDYPPERFRFLCPRNQQEFESTLCALIRAGHHVYPRDLKLSSKQLTFDF